MSRLFIVAGEVSGDTHASGLMRELLTLNPATIFAGLGGPRMREIAGDSIDNWIEKAAVVGLWEVIKIYGYFRQKMQTTVEEIFSSRPDAVILIDYPGFNLSLAKRLRKNGYTGKLIYYISPQVWAWKKGRVKVMAKVLDLMICIFPFEKEFYEKSGLRTEFGGHPMVDRITTLRRHWERERGLVGWFPGSRLDEVRRLFPVMLEAARAIRMQFPGARFAVSAASESLAGHMRTLAEMAGMPDAKQWIEVGTVYDLMQRAEVGAVASGTATLEAACFGLPYTLVYKVNPLTYAVAKTVVRIKHIGIVNVLAQREVVRELVQAGLTSDTLAAEMVEFLANDRRRKELQEDLASVVATLGAGGAYARAARAVADCLSK